MKRQLTQGVLGNLHEQIMEREADECDLAVERWSSINTAI
jgi:hypothetical protein